VQRPTLPIAGGTSTMAPIASPPPSPRPWWMTAMALFCVATIVFLVPRDLFFAATRDVEVWFGFGRNID
jgi:hypothetical protein